MFMVAVVLTSKTPWAMTMLVVTMSMLEASYFVLAILVFLLLANNSMFLFLIFLALVVAMVLFVSVVTVWVKTLETSLYRM